MTLITALEEATQVELDVVIKVWVKYYCSFYYEKSCVLKPVEEARNLLGTTFSCSVSDSREGKEYPEKLSS